MAPPAAMALGTLVRRPILGHIIQFRRQPIETRETRLIVVDNKVLLAPIAVREITLSIKGRFRQYLNLLELKIGIIANFHAPSLEIEVVRI